MRGLTSFNIAKRIVAVGFFIRILLSARPLYVEWRKLGTVKRSGKFPLFRNFLSDNVEAEEKEHRVSANRQLTIRLTRKPLTLLL